MTHDMYKANILDHYKHPRNQGKLEPADAHAHVSNPLCGDELDFCLNFDAAGRVSEVKFTGRGCTISMAAASMLTEKLVGMSRGEIQKLPTEYPVNLLGVEIVPARLKCATLGLEGAQRATANDVLPS